MKWGKEQWVQSYEVKVHTANEYEMNSTGLWCNEQLEAVDAMNNLGMWMSWTTQEEGHYTPKREDYGLRL